MLEINFPQKISYNSISIIEFYTNIVIDKNGHEIRNILRDCQMKFNIKNGIKSREELNELLIFFRKVKGNYYAFRFKDWTDYKVVGQNIGIGDNEKTNFQLIKSYDDYLRKITLPILSTLQISINNQIITDYEISNGMVKFITPPPSNATIRADFEFDVKTRFLDSKMEISMNDINNGFIKDIMLLEVIN